MNWNPPDTESAWADYLSAYVDGELPPEEAQALEHFLLESPERAAQLESLRDTEAMLAEWEIPDPPQDEAFLERLDGVARRESPPPPRRAGWRWQWQAAMFAFGALVGVDLTLTFVGSGGQGPDAAVPPPQTPAVESSVPEPSISAEQAEGLFRELAAASLKERCLSLLRRRRWREASAAVNTLKRDYPNTVAAEETVEALNRVQSMGMAAETTGRD